MSTIQKTSTKSYIVQYLMRATQATAQQISEALEISPQAVRRHLKDLESEGLVSYTQNRPKIGRTQHVYSVSSKGKAELPHRYSEFAVTFLDALVETVGQEKVSQAFHKQWQHKAEEYSSQLGKGSLKTRVSKLVQLRKQEGYMAEFFPVKNSQAENKETAKFFLAEHNCAISDVAESFPSVCEHELEMFAAIFPDCIIERTQWINNGEHRCGYLIQAKE